MSDKGGQICDVSTTASNDRCALGSGSWRVESAEGKDAGDVVEYGDKLQLKNMWRNDDGDQAYLDVCNMSDKGGQIYEVSTTASNDRDNGSGTWQIESAAEGEGPVSIGSDVHLLNQYGDNFSYLDTCCRAEPDVLWADSQIYDVSTTAEKNRDNGTGIWHIEWQAGLVV